jgi:hypothetical protein
VDVRILFKTAEFISLLSQLKQHRLSITALQKKEVRGEELETEKIGGAF